jgi:maltose O-acetyltransferase
MATSRVPATRRCAVPDADSSERESPAGFVARLVREETSGLHPRLLFLQLFNALQPKRHAERRRASLLRLAGFAVGEGTDVFGLPYMNGSRPNAHGDGNGGLYANLAIGAHVTIARGAVFDLEHRISIGDHVMIEPQVMILTSTHDLGPRERRAGPVTRAPVTIGNGAWIGARAVILPGVTIGDGAIVAPGAVVNKDVAENTRVAGVPAKKVETLETRGDEGRSAGVA